MHDADTIGDGITVDIASGTESVELYNGTAVQLDEGDMFMRMRLASDVSDQGTGALWPGDAGDDASCRLCLCAGSLTTR